MFRLAFLSAALLAFAGAAQANTYHVDGSRQMCPYGGGEGIITIGPGTLSITETHYERRGARQTLPGGWQRATWECQSEGMSCGRETIDLRFDDKRIDLRFADGRTMSGLRCPR